jgi:hypothetical protein
MGQARAGPGWNILGALNLEVVLLSNRILTNTNIQDHQPQPLVPNISR